MTIWLIFKDFFKNTKYIICNVELIYNLALCPRFLRQYVIGVWIKINHVWRYSSVHWLLLLCDHPTSLNLFQKVKIQCIMPSDEPMFDAFYSKTVAIWYLYIQKLVPFLIPRFGRTLWWGGHHLSGALHIPVIRIKDFCFSTHIF